MKNQDSFLGTLQDWWLVLILVLIWQGGSWLGVWTTNLLPSPLDVLKAALNMMATGVLLKDVIASVLRVICGFTISAALGTSLGLILGSQPRLSRPFHRLIELLRPIPPIAWIPLAIRWVGIGNTSSIFIVAMGAFFPIFLNTFEAVANVRMAYINVATCLGAGPRLLLTDIILPAAAPQILIGLRVGLGIAWTSLIAAELISAHSGLGYMIQMNRLMLQMENVIAGMVVIGLIGLGMNALSYRMERLLLPWANETLRSQAV